MFIKLPNRSHKFIFSVLEDKVQVQYFCFELTISYYRQFQINIAKNAKNTSAILFQNGHWAYSFKNRFLKGSAQSREMLSSRIHLLKTLNIWCQFWLDGKNLKFITENFHIILSYYSTITQQYCIVCIKSKCFQWKKGFFIIKDDFCFSFMGLGH